MKEIFAFWGYGRQVWEESEQWLTPINPSNAPLATQFGRIIFRAGALDLVEDFREEIKGRGLLSFIKVPPQIRADGEEIVGFESLDRASSFPLVTLDPSGRFKFYFDLDQTIRFIQQERYLKYSAPLYSRWGLKPDDFPSFLRMAVLHCFQVSRFVSSGMFPPLPFPRSYKDFSVDIWRFLIRAIIDRNGQKGPPSVPLWPDGKKYACVLNHDVDTSWGFEAKEGIEALRAIEEKRGLVSAWMIVSGLWKVGENRLRDLSSAGHEIGFHGIQNDHGLAYLPESRIRKKLAPAMPFLKEFRCAGFRNTSFHRSSALYRAMDSVIQYDMSMHDSFENVNHPWISYEGCSTCFPFKIEGTDILEIPTTVSEDFVLEMRKFSPEEALRCQLNLVDQIKKRLGVVNILTHPEPHFSSRREWRENYDRLLEHVVKDDSLWIALPRDLAHWWRERQKKIDDLWKVESQLPLKL